MQRAVGPVVVRGAHLLAVLAHFFLLLRLVLHGGFQVGFHVDQIFAVVVATSAAGAQKKDDESVRYEERCDVLIFVQVVAVRFDELEFHVFDEVRDSSIYIFVRLWQLLNTHHIEIVEVSSTTREEVPRSIIGAVVMITQDSDFH